MNEDSLIGIFKLGRKDHMSELLHEGHVFMNTVSYFARLKDGSPRSDPDEGIAYCRNADGGMLQVQEGTEWHTVGSLTGAIRFRNEDLEPANLYCLHARTARDYGVMLELNTLGFGDAYALFRDPNEFFRRLEDAAHLAGHEFRYDMVDYVDRRSYTGPMGMFRKFSERAADQELRVAVLPGTDSPLSLRLGDLSDIAVMGSTTERLRLDPKGPPNTAEALVSV